MIKQNDARPGVTRCDTCDNIADYFQMHKALCHDCYIEETKDLKASSSIVKKASFERYPKDIKKFDDEDLL